MTIFFCNFYLFIFIFLFNATTLYTNSLNCSFNLFNFLLTFSFIINTWVGNFLIVFFLFLFFKDFSKILIKFNKTQLFFLIIFFKYLKIFNTTLLSSNILDYKAIKFFKSINTQLLDGLVSVHPFIFYISVVLLLLVILQIFKVVKFNKFYFFTSKHLIFNNFFKILLINFLIAALLTGGYWAYSQFVWGFWWTWDNVEFILLLFLMLFLLLLHKYFVFTQSNFLFIYKSFLITTYLVIILRLGFVQSRHSFFNKSVNMYNYFSILTFFFGFIFILIQLGTYIKVFKINLKFYNFIIDFIFFFTFYSVIFLFFFNFTFFFFKKLNFFIFFLFYVFLCCNPTKLKFYVYEYFVFYFFHIVLFALCFIFFFLHKNNIFFFKKKTIKPTINMFVSLSVNYHYLSLSSLSTYKNFCIFSQNTNKKSFFKSHKSAFFYYYFTNSLIVNKIYINFSNYNKNFKMFNVLLNNKESKNIFLYNNLTKFKWFNLYEFFYNADGLFFQKKLPTINFKAFNLANSIKLVKLSFNKFNYNDLILVKSADRSVKISNTFLDTLVLDSISVKFFFIFFIFIFFVFFI